MASWNKHLNDTNLLRKFFGTALLKEMQRDHYFRKSGDVSLLERGPSHHKVQALGAEMMATTLIPKIFGQLSRKVNCGKSPGIFKY